MTADYSGSREVCCHWANGHQNLSKFFKYCIDFMLRSTLLALLQEVLAYYPQAQVVEARDESNLEDILVPS